MTLKLESEPTSDYPEGALNREAERGSSLATTIEATNISEELGRNSKPNSSRNAPVKKKTNYRKTHGVQFQKQFESLNVPAGPLFLRANAPSELENEETPQSEDLELSHLEKCVDHWQYFRYRCGLLINDTRVQVLIVNLIAINAITMGIATFDFVRGDPQVQNAFEVTDLVFLIIFTVELGMQSLFYGIRLLTDGWLVFDLIIISFSWIFSQVQIIRSFRIFRAFRLVTRIKVLKNLVLGKRYNALFSTAVTSKLIFPMLLSAALFSVVPRMFAIGILLLLVYYIFAVMFTQLFKNLYEDGYTEEDYFGRMDKTFFTLFQLMTLDNWADVAREVIAVYSWAWIPFVFFVIATGFVVVNLIIAVICDAISALHEDEKAKLHGTYEEGSQEESSSSKPGGADENEDSFELEEAEEEDDYHIDIDVRAQLDSLEHHVLELSQMQEDALKALEMLTQSFQAHSTQASSNSSNGDVGNGTAIRRR